MDGEKTTRRHCCSGTKTRHSYNFSALVLSSAVWLKPNLLFWNPYLSDFFKKYCNKYRNVDFLTRGTPWDFGAITSQPSISDRVNPFIQLGKSHFQRHQVLPLISLQRPRQLKHFFPHTTLSVTQNPCSLDDTGVINVNMSPSAEHILDTTRGVKWSIDANG